MYPYKYLSFNTEWESEMWHEYKEVIQPAQTMKYIVRVEQHVNPHAKIEIR